MFHKVLKINECTKKLKALKYLTVASLIFLSLLTVREFTLQTVIGHS